MNRRNIMSLSAISALALAILTGSALAQQKTLKEQIVGTWSVASWELTYPDGRKEQQFGTNPKGVNTFDSNGRFSLIILRSDLPKVASNDRVKPTPDEAMAIAKGAIAYYGTFTVDEASKTLNLNLEGTSFTNQIGAPQKRIVTAISGDEMKYRNPASTTGGTIELGLKRVK